MDCQLILNQLLDSDIPLATVFQDLECEKYVDASTELDSLIYQKFEIGEHDKLDTLVISSQWNLNQFQRVRVSILILISGGTFDADGIKTATDFLKGQAEWQRVAAGG